MSEMIILANLISEMRGEYFLYFFIPAGILAVILTCIIHFVVRSSNGEELRPSTSVNPYRISWLRGGVEEMALTAVCHLMGKGLIESHEKKFRMAVLDDRLLSIADELRGVELLVWNNIKSFSEIPNKSGLKSLEPGVDRAEELAIKPGPDISLDEILNTSGLESLEPEVNRAEEWAIKNGLIIRPIGKMLEWLPIGLWLVIGVYKLILGLDNSRPVGNLWTTLFIGGGLSYIWHSEMSKRTRRGDKYLTDLQDIADGYSANLDAETPLIATSRQGVDPVFIFAVAALGPGFLAGTQMDLVATAIPSAIQASSSGGGCSSGCGGGGCGGGCGGCGG